MEEALPDLEALHAFAAQRFELRRNFPQGFVADVASLVDRLHDALAEAVGRVKDQLAVPVGQPVEGVDRAVHEGFYDVVHVRLLFKKTDQVLLVVQAKGVQGPHPGIGFGHHRIAGPVDQVAGFFQGTDHPAFGHRHAGFLKSGLHLGFVPYSVDLMAPDT